MFQTSIVSPPPPRRPSLVRPTASRGSYTGNGTQRRKEGSQEKKTRERRQKKEPEGLDTTEMSHPASRQPVSSLAVGLVLCELRNTWGISTIGTYGVFCSVSCPLGVHALGGSCHRTTSFKMQSAAGGGSPGLGPAGESEREREKREKSGLFRGAP